MKNIVIINGHPNKDSYNFALSEAYIKGAKETDAIIQVVNINELDFNPNLQYGYQKRMEHEPDLKEALQKILQADHLVWIFPMWWYGLPALMKGFIDRTFLPGITFAYQEKSPFPKKLLVGKTARIIMTSDTPRWYDALIMGKPTIRQFKNGVLKFCGVKSKVTYIAPIKGSKETFRKNWLKKVETLGKNNR